MLTIPNHLYDSTSPPFPKSKPCNTVKINSLLDLEPMVKLSGSL